MNDVLVWLVVINVPSTARSFRDGTPIYCPLRRTCSSINTPFRPGIEPRAVALQSITLPALRYASSTYNEWGSLKAMTQCIQWIGVLFLDWFEWDYLRLENVKVVTQQTQPSHINVNIWVLFILYLVYMLRAEWPFATYLYIAGLWAYLQNYKVKIYKTTYW